MRLGRPTSRRHAAAPPSGCINMLKKSQGRCQDIPQQCICEHIGEPMGNLRRECMSL